MIIAEIPKANYCSFFCFLLTMDECIINVWGYTEILPGKIVHYTEQLEEQILVRKTPATSSAGKCEATEYRCHWE